MADKPSPIVGYRSYLKPGESAPLPNPPAPHMVAPAELEPHRKRALWDWMKANDPATADYLANLKTDPHVSALEAAFGPVRPVVTLDYIRGAIG